MKLQEVNTSPTAPPDGVAQVMRIGRAWRGWSQRQLAVALGWHIWRVSKIELGVIQPTEEQVAQILDALDLPGMESDA